MRFTCSSEKQSRWLPSACGPLTPTLAECLWGGDHKATWVGFFPPSPLFLFLARSFFFIVMVTGKFCAMADRCLQLSLKSEWKGHQEEL